MENFEDGQETGIAAVAAAGLLASNVPLAAKVNVKVQSVIPAKAYEVMMPGTGGPL